jgi:hypothetical protein
LTDEQAAHLIAITCSTVPDGHDPAVLCACWQAKPLNWDTYGASHPKRCANCSKKCPETVATCGCRVCCHNGRCFVSLCSTL